MAITSANQLELLQTAEAVAREKMIDPSLVLEAMEESLSRAAKSRYGSEMDIQVSIDRKTGQATFTRVRTVVEEELLENYQAEMAKRAVANGFLFGKGPGKGHVKNDLYSAQSDFIYASSIEEFGSIIGGIGLVILYMILFFRAIRIMNKVDSKFASFIVFGLSFMLIFQSFINMGVGVNLFPVTGQPLPLISMGGTSILFSCISLGIILNVSTTVYKDSENV